ncbi:MAG: glycosyltransferase [Bacillota bacterium]
MAGGQPLNVLHIISDTNIGGAGSYLLNFLEFFDRSLLNVRVVCPAGSLLAARCAAKGVEVIETARMPGDESFQLQGLSRQIRELVYIIRKHRIQAVHTHASFAGRLAAKIAGVKCIIYTKHRLDEIKKPLKNSWKDKLRQLVNDRTCSRVIAVSEAVRENLIRQGVNPGKIVVIHNGIDIEGLRKRAQQTGIQKNGRNREEKGGFPAGWPLPGTASSVVGMVARLEPEKGHRYFLEAARDILTIKKNVKFVIVGTGSLETELKERARALGIQEAVIFTGFQENVAGLLAAMDVVVLPSLTESFGLSLVEGMCLGKPCVASRVGGIKEIITDWENGLLVEPGNARGLAEKVFFLLQNPTFAQELGRRAARTVEEKFDARIMAGKITELYYHHYYK